MKPQISGTFTLFSVLVI